MSRENQIEKMERYIDANALIEVLQEWRDTSSLKDGAGNPVDSILYDVIRRIEDAPTADIAPRAEWISVNERLPDKSGIYIIELKERKYEYLAYFDVRLYADGKWLNIPDKLTVTHWMPMPEPSGSASAYKKRDTRRTISNGRLLDAPTRKH